MTTQNSKDLQHRFSKETINNVNTFDCRYADQYIWWLEQKVIESESKEKEAAWDHQDEVENF